MYGSQDKITDTSKKVEERKGLKKKEILELRKLENGLYCLEGDISQLTSKDLKTLKDQITLALAVEISLIPPNNLKRKVSRMDIIGQNGNDGDHYE